MEKQPHIQLSGEDVCSKAIIVGDLARVEKIGAFLTDVRPLADNREFKSLRGKYKGCDIMALSTGIGAPSACIAVEELARTGVREIIRVGSCGAMQKDIALGELVIALGAVRCDGLTKNYLPENYPAIPSLELLERAQKLAPEAVYGIIRSHDGFYMDDNEAVEEYWSHFGIVGADMESSALFVVGSLRKVKTLSILNNVVIYQGDLADGVNDLVAGEDKVALGEKKSIELALEILAGGK